MAFAVHITMTFEGHCNPSRKYRKQGVSLMLKRIGFLMVLSVGLVGLSWGCVGVGQPPAGQCAAGQEHHTPGCGDGNDDAFKAGCYTPCDANKKCPSGEECKQVTVTPACAKNTGGVSCDACGSGAFLCFPQGNGQCPSGQEHHTPGCGGDANQPKITAGCYTPCADDSACPSGKTCKTVDVTPECAKSTGPVVCGACGQSKKLCVD